MDTRTDQVTLIRESQDRFLESLQIDGRPLTDREKKYILAGAANIIEQLQILQATMMLAMIHHNEALDIGALLRMSVAVSLNSMEVAHANRP